MNQTEEKIVRIRNLGSNKADVVSIIKFYNFLKLCLLKFLKGNILIKKVKMLITKFSKFCGRDLDKKFIDYMPSRSFKFGSEFRSKEMKGRPLFSSFLEILHEKWSAFYLLGSEF